MRDSPGVVHHVRFPVSAVMGIYARETGEGMMFAGAGHGPENPPPSGPAPPRKAAA